MPKVLRFAIACMLVLFAGRSLDAQLPAQAEEEAKVRAVIELYLRAHATGDGNLIRQAFHPQLRLMSSSGDTLATRAADVYANGFRGVPPADEAQRRRWIASVEVFGTAAAARVVLDYPNATFVDFFTLLKFGEEWKIVTKTFATQPKPRPAP